jgi:circadian clock protein KaiB
MEGKKAASKNKFILKLFVSGASPNSVRAINNLQKILEQHIPGQYEMNVIDVHQDKALAEKEQIVALPLLVKKFPLPERRMIGDMSDTIKLLRGLGISE